MNSQRLTLILLAASLVLLATMPMLTGSWFARGEGHLWPDVTDRKCEEVALAHPDDAELWLGYAAVVSGYDRLRVIAEELRQNPLPYSEMPTRLGATTTSAEAAFTRAVALAPNSVVPRLWQATELLAQAGGLLRPEGKPEWPAPSHLPTRTEAETKRLRAAEAVLVECRRLEPDNAACDYLLVWAYLADRRDADAFAVLDEATGKNRFDLHERECGLAVERVLRAAGDTTVGVYNGAAWAMRSPTATHMRSLARVLQRFALDARDAGHHAQAVRCLRAMLHFGHVMRVSAYDGVGGFTGIAVSAMGTVPLTAEQTAQRKAIADPVAGSDWINRTRVANTAAYLRAHGSPALAEFLERDAEAGRQWKGAFRAYVDRDIGERSNRLTRLRCAYVLWGLAAMLMFQALCVRVLSLLLKGNSETDGGIRTGWVSISALMAVSCAPGLLVLHYMPLLVAQKGVSLSWMAPLLIVGVLVGGAIWCIGAFAVAFAKRGRLGADSRPDPWNAFRRVVGQMVGLTVALLIFLPMLLLWPSYRIGGSYEIEQRQYIEVGDVQAQGITDANPGAMPR